jgi:hypothetical protein
MARYCGACAKQLGSARENEGSFQTDSSFKGWDRKGGASQITDTCADCAAILKRAVSDAANMIAGRHRDEVEALRLKVEEWRQHDERVKTEELAFRREWDARRRDVK